MRFTCVKVGDLCEQIRGVSYEKGEALTSPRPGYVPILRANNITDRGLVYDELVYVPEQRVSAYQRLRRFDVVIAASSGSKDVVGKAAPVLDDFDGSFGAFCKVLRPNQKVDPRYFAHFFKTKHYRQTVSALAAGANISNLRNEHLEDLDIPLPSLSEQMRIAEVLDRAETLRRQRQSALDWLSMLVDVMFAELFQGALSAARWPIVRLGDVAAIQGGLQLSGKRAALPIEVPYLRVANVYRGYIDLTEVKTLRATPEEVSRTRLLANDLLIVEGHGNATEIGRCALWDGSVDPCVHQNHLIRVRVDQERLDPVFLCHYLNSPQGRQHLLRSAKTTSGLNTISTSNVKETPVVVPPMSLQKQFVERVTRVERVRATNLASLAQLEALYASLQHRAFRGEL